MYCCADPMNSDGATVPAPVHFGHCTRMQHAARETSVKTATAVRALNRKLVCRPFITRAPSWNARSFTASDCLNALEPVFSSEPVLKVRQLTWREAWVKGGRLNRRGRSRVVVQHLCYCIEGKS